MKALIWRMGPIDILVAVSLMFAAAKVTAGAPATAPPQDEQPPMGLSWKVYPPLPRPRAMNVSMEVLVDGRPLQVIHHRGRMYLPVSRVGEEYEIRVRNNGPKRIVAIVSVDGLSVISGQPASEAQSGYIVAPYSSIRIKGWRRSLDRVAAFRFVDRHDSYAYKVGRPENVGVIGLVAIEELVLQPRYEMEKMDSARAPGAGKAHHRHETGSIGTEYGRDIDSRVYYVPFVRSSNKVRITYYYDTVEELRRSGVPVDPYFPIPFPADPRFAPPPPTHRER